MRVPELPETADALIEETEERLRPLCNELEERYDDETERNKDTVIQTKNNIS